MFATGHVLKINSDGTIAVIRFKDHINGQRRTYRSDDMEYVINEARRGFSQNSACSDGESDKTKNDFIAVPVSAYKELRPHWFVTEDELMEKYQLAQRDQKVDIPPELIPYAKKIWSARVKKLSDGVAETERMNKPSVMCESSVAEDHEGVPLK